MVDYTCDYGQHMCKNEKFEKMKKIWKGQLKCPIVLGFDLDGVSGVINRDPTSRNLPSLMSMRDYGPLIATPRILDLLDQHQIKASFYIPGFIAETNIDLVKTIANKGHEVGHHGYMHEPPATLTELEESNILDQGTEILENITGTRPIGSVSYTHLTLPTSDLV